MAGNISCEKELKLKKAAIEMEYVSNLNLPLRVDDLQLKIELARKGYRFLTVQKLYFVQPRGQRHCFQWKGWKLRNRRMRW